MVRINFVGDVAIFKEFERLKIDPLESVLLPDSDFNVANFEFPVPNDIAQKKFFDVDDNFRTSQQYNSELKYNKFNAYSLANNHILDYGMEGVIDTVQKITKHGQSTFGVGNKGFNALAQTISNISFLFVGVVKPGRWDRQEGTLGPDPYCMNSLAEFIRENKDLYDHIIIFPHWGTELVDAPDPVDVNNARNLIDAGARCVIGHHPHVSQGVEQYKHGFIAYSLGSFIYLPDFEKGNSDKSKSRDMSICLNLTFTKDSIEDFIPYRYILDRDLSIPICHGSFKHDNEFLKLCSVIGSNTYYSKEVRRILLRREFISFKERFLNNPTSTLVHYARYLKIKHFKKILGIR